jgi:hypothetical protein
MHPVEMKKLALDWGEAFTPLNCPRAFEKVGHGGALETKKRLCEGND